MTRARLLALSFLPLLAVPGLLLAQGRETGADKPSSRLESALADAERAERRARALEQAAREMRDKAKALEARRVAAAEAILATESRISAAEIRARAAASAYRDYRARLRAEQAPAAHLLAGLATMSARPPLVSLLDEGSTQDFVRTRILLDSVLPAIEARTRKIARDAERARLLRSQAVEALQSVKAQRVELARRVQAYAALEREALADASTREASALDAGDVALARTEDASRFGREARRRREAAAMARDLAARKAVPHWAGGGGTMERSPLSYRLPTGAAVTRGFGTIGETGIRARGTRFDTRRGERIVAPAAGRVVFAGPYGRRDGIVILDHGEGWTSLLLDVSPSVGKGETVATGQSIGRALGPMELELSHNGQRQSPALIAGSSAILSKTR